MLQYLNVSKTQKVAFAFDRLFNIEKYHLYTKNSTFLCYTQVNIIFAWKIITLLFNKYLSLPSTYPLRPVIMSNTRPLRITAAAGTKLAGASSLSTRHDPP